MYALLVLGQHAKAGESGGEWGAAAVVSRRQTRRPRCPCMRQALPLSIRRRRLARNSTRKLCLCLSLTFLPHCRRLVIQSRVRHILFHVCVIMKPYLRLLRRPATWVPGKCNNTGRRCLSVPAAELRFGQPLHETHPHLLKAGEGATMPSAS